MESEERDRIGGVQEGVEFISTEGSKGREKGEKLGEKRGSVSLAARVERGREK